jgi:hypothetical protein
MGIFADKPTDCFNSFLEKIFALSYPKEKIIVVIHDVVLVAHCVPHYLEMISIFLTLAPRSDRSSRRNNGESFKGIRQSQVLRTAEFNCQLVRYCRVQGNGNVRNEFFF